MKTVCVIPARYKSSRFPGKPLADICGKPMIWWVYQQAKQVKEFDAIYVATESDKVEGVCKELGINVILTADTHPTGTDRVGEVAQKIDADLYVIWMGDEPCIEPTGVHLLLDEFKKNSDIDACMLSTKFSNPVDVVNTTTIKLAINKNNELIFMSRSPIPYPKANLSYCYYKNMGAYAMKKSTLDFFLSTEVGTLENVEEIELLRLLENHKLVKTVLVESTSFSIDTPKDLEKVNAIMKSKGF